jgi:type II secretory pathway component PulJ
MNNTAKKPMSAKRAAGFSYTEMVLATFLLAIVLVPTLESLGSGIQSSNLHAARATDHYRLSGKLEEVLAKPFAELVQQADSAGGPTAIVTAYSDMAGTQGRRLVYLARYDGDNADADNNPFSGDDQGLLWVEVQLEDASAVLHTLISE